MPMAVNVSVYRELTYSATEDVTPICGLTRSMAIIVVPQNSPLKSLEDLVARGKAEPKLNMGTYSAGYQLAVAPFLEKGGKIRALAVTGNERHPELPDIPTLVELGYEDAVHYSWTSL
jgi:tripartite-type tricarboxylate transporter receptor subunit TctC